MDKLSGRDDRGEASKRRRLKELALEASRHLDVILPGGDGSKPQEPARPEHDRSGEVSHKRDETGKRAGPAEEVAQAPKRSISRVSPIGGQAPARAAKSVTGPSGFADGNLRAAGQAEPSQFAREGAKAGRPSALVVHVSRGVAGVLANLLGNMGVKTEIATNLKEARSIPADGYWDLLFIQGTAMPHPGKELATSVLDSLRQSPQCIILLARRGDTLLAEAGASRAAGVLEWPFSPMKVETLLAQVLPTAKARRPKQK